MWDILYFTVFGCRKRKVSCSRMAYCRHFAIRTWKVIVANEEGVM
jgi:hypothetical protein